ncbi:MAG TPA: restriction endonuclease subunit S [Candidatus Acidoferrum sp.]|nr:restriction endonuclease subunit S [Candidatus Acidoferrum sp.]
MGVRTGYKQSEVGVIPADWEVRPVGEVFSICDELRVPLSETVRQSMGGPYPYYGPTGILGHIDQYHLDGEYAIIGQDGSHFLKWRDTPQTHLLRGKFTVNNHVHLIKGSLQYLAAWFAASFCFRDLTRYLTRQTADRYQLTKQALSRIPCALPPAAEQHGIVAMLSDAEAVLAGMDALLAKAGAVKHALMRQLLTGTRRLAGFRGDWTVTPLEKLGDCSTGGTPPTERPECWGGDLIWLPSGRIHGQILAAPEPADAAITRVGLRMASARRITAPAVLIAVSGVTCGEVALLRFDAATNQCVVAVEPHPGVDAQFLFYALAMKRADILARQNGSTRGRTCLQAVKKISMIVPGLDEQKTIAAVLAETDAEIAALEGQRGQARALSRALHQELLTGRKRLR